MYLNLPIVVHYKIENIIIGGGIYTSYLARAKLRSGNFKVDQLDLLKRRDLGFVGDVGFIINDKMKVFVRGYYSMFSIRADNVIWYNNNLTLGMKIALN